MLSQNAIDLIRRKLRQHNLSMRSASMEAGLSADALRKILEGRDPRAGSLKKLSKSLGIPMVVLLDDEDSTTALPPVFAAMPASVKVETPLQLDPGALQTAQEGVNACRAKRSGNPTVHEVTELFWSFYSDSLRQRRSGNTGTSQGEESEPLM